MKRRTAKHTKRWHATWVATAVLCASTVALAQQPNGTAPAATAPAWQANAPAQRAGGYYAAPTPPAAQSGAPQTLPATAGATPSGNAWQAGTSQLPQQQAAPPRTLGAPNQQPTAAPAVGPPGVQRASYQTAGQRPAGEETQPPGSKPLPAPYRSDLPLPGSTQRPVGPVAMMWTLQQVEALSLEFNPVLRHSWAQIESARGDAQQASLYPNPRFDTNNPEVFAGQNSSYNAGFMQDIVVKGKLRLDRAAANEVVRQREHGLTVNRFTLLTAVRQQFYSVLAAQRRIALLEDLLNIATLSVRATQGKLDSGDGTRSEVLLTQTELYRAQLALRNARTVLDAELRQLSAIIGRPDVRIERVSGDFTTGFPDYDPENLRMFVISQNAQVQVARREIDRQQILLRRARVEPYPNVRVGPTYNSNLTPTPGTSQFWFTVQFDIPVWNRNQGNIRSTQGDLADAIASLGVLQNDLLAKVEDVLGRYMAARQSEEQFRTQILPTAQQALELVRAAYKPGVVDISTLLQAQRTNSETSLNYYDALENVWTTAAEIANLLQLDRFP